MLAISTEVSFKSTAEWDTQNSEVDLKLRNKLIRSLAKGLKAACSSLCGGAENEASLSLKKNVPPDQALD